MSTQDMRKLSYPRTIIFQQAGSASEVLKIRIVMSIRFSDPTCELGAQLAVGRGFETSDRVKPPVGCLDNIARNYIPGHLDLLH